MCPSSLSSSSPLVLAENGVVWGSSCPPSSVGSGTVEGVALSAHRGKTRFPPRFHGCKGRCSVGAGGADRTMLGYWGPGRDERGQVGRARQAQPEEWCGTLRGCSWGGTTVCLLHPKPW